MRLQRAMTRCAPAGELLPLTGHQLQMQQEQPLLPQWILRYYPPHFARSSTLGATIDRRRDILRARTTTALANQVAIEQEVVPATVTQIPRIPYPGVVYPLSRLASLLQLGHSAWTGSRDTLDLLLLLLPVHSQGQHDPWSIPQQLARVARLETWQIGPRLCFPLLVRATAAGRALQSTLQRQCELPDFSSGDRANTSMCSTVFAPGTLPQP